MSIAKKIRFLFLFSFLFTIGLFSFKENYAMASATDYHFVIGSKEYQAGTTYNLISDDEISISVEVEGLAQPATIELSSSETSVVSLVQDPSDITKQNLKKKGPGFSIITAKITTAGGNILYRRVQIQVDFEIIKLITGLDTSTTTKNKMLPMEAVGKTQQIWLKNVDYTSTQGTTVSGGAISATSLNYKSDNEGVATVSTYGVITAVGSGNCNITITSKTFDMKEKPMVDTIRVVVRPKFTLTLQPATGSAIVYNSQIKDDNPVIVDNVPTEFIIVSEAEYAKNLTWVVYAINGTSRKKLSPDSDKLKYILSDKSGNVNFLEVKAGTYEIYAFAHPDYSENTNAPYAYMKIVVPIAMKNLSLVMQVGDTYNIFENSNIPSINAFNYSTSASSIARIDQTKSVITARSKGTATITCSLNESLKLFNDDIGDITIVVTVIDGISLNITDAILKTGGELRLSANVTDSKASIVWSTSDPKIATVDDDGLVTGISAKEGADTATITATQTINGVTKKATCMITVRQSVSNIVLDPKEVTLAIGTFTTIKATLTPANLKGIILKWKSSNEGIVSIVDINPLTATIQGVSGGHAVISAINQDNVVVGYCHVSVQQPVTGIVLSETEITVSLTTTGLQLRAVVSPENALNKEITWSSTDTSKATVDANGLVTFKKTGTVSIIATSKDNPSKTGICNINIQIPVSTISLDEKTKTMYAGQTARLSYVLLPTNASTNSVSWTSTNTAVATVDGTGKVTAKSAGTAVIILKSLDSGQSVHCTITVKQVATGLKLDVTSLDLTSGEYYVIKPTITPADSTDIKIVWESSDTKVAIVDANGRVTAKSAGTAVIMAKIASGATVYCKVKVTQPVSGLLLNYYDKTIYIGEKFELDVSVSPTSATELGVVWKISNDKVATIDKDGVVTALAGGVAIVTCTTVDGGYSVTCVVTVLEGVSSISMNYQTYYLGVDKTIMLVATVTNATATNQKVSWTTSNSDVATVTQKGKVIGVKSGYATITATALDGSEVETSCEIQVVTPVSSVSLNKSTLTLLVGQTKKLKATIKPATATIKSAKWSSSDSSVAIVDEDGEVIAIKAGTTTITAEARDNSGKKALSYVTVYDRVASTGITLQDKKIVMIPGEEKVIQVALVPTASTDDITWSTDNAAVARVDKETGKIIARATGIAYITAMTDSGKTATVEVTVIGLNKTKLVLEQYTTYPYPLQVEGATTTVSWSIDNPRVAVVSNGTVSSRGVGTATITAKVNGRNLTCKIKVVKID